VSWARTRDGPPREKERARKGGRGSQRVKREETTTPPISNNVSGGGGGGGGFGKIRRKECTGRKQF